MVLVDMDGSSLPVISVQFSWLSLRVGGPLAPSLNSSNKLVELPQWLAMHHRHYHGFFSCIA